MANLSFIVQPDGKLPQAIKATLANMIPSFAGRRVQLTIADAKDKRSLDQNNYYRGVVLPHVRRVRFDMGDPMSLDEVHEALLDEYAPTVDGKRLDGKSFNRPKRTREMNKEEMADFITSIIAKMAIFGSPVPEAV